MLLHEIMDTTESRLNFLVGIIFLAKADGEVDATEIAFFQNIAAALNIDVSSLDSYWAAQGTPQLQFSSMLQKKFFIREAVKLCYSSNGYDESEKRLLHRFAEDLGVPKKVVSKFEDWAKRGVKWSEEGDSLLSEDSSDSGLFSNFSLGKLSDKCVAGVTENKATIGKVLFGVVAVGGAVAAAPVVIPVAAAGATALGSGAVALGAKAVVAGSALVQGVDMLNKHAPTILKTLDTVNSLKETVNQSRVVEQQVLPTLNQECGTVVVEKPSIMQDTVENLTVKTVQEG